MTRPKRYLTRMVVFLLIVSVAVLFLFPTLRTAFVHNMVLNGVILGALLIGIIHTFRNVTMLQAEVNWLETFQRDEMTIADSTAAPPRLLAPMATMLGERRPDRLSLSAISMRSLLDGIAMRLDESRATELASGIVQLAGPWNVVVVRQPDGLVILEAPISADYSRDVVAAAERRFPGVPIKAIVTTSDAWPHIGGVREYVARRLPVYALDLNIPILDRLARAPRSRRPDMLARTPAPPRWTRVADRRTIGTGELRIELIPVRGEVGERMMMAWLPQRKLLYASDLIQRNRSGGFFMPGMLAEVLSAVEREHLGTPERVIAMHLAATPWTEIVAAVERVRTAVR